MGSYSYKNIALGIGIGLIISSIVNLSMDSREMTVEEIKKEASRYNLIVLTKDEILSNQAQPKNAAADVSVSAEQKDETESDLVVVEIERGMTSESIAGLLKDKGLINDEKEFTRRILEAGKEKSLRVGRYEISKNLGYDDIIRILTGE